jgi:23S rRNA (pseudouridine1915-N3)-methyltransferase
MKLHILAIGKKKSDYDTMIAEYQKRIVSPFSLSLEIIEPLGIDNPVQCRTKESEKLATKLQPGDYIIALDETGKDFTTVAFSHHIEKQMHTGIKRMVFIIGGAYGIDTSLQSRAHLILRLGSFTLPHELARLVLAEQLYRVTNLLGGGKYHHE